MAFCRNKTEKCSGQHLDNRKRNERGEEKKKELCLRWEVVDTSGGVEGSGEDGWVWDKIVCEDIVEATTDFSGSERIVGKVFLGKGKGKKK